MRVCIIGDSGLLGQAFLQELGSNASHRILGVSSSEFVPSSYLGSIQAEYRHIVARLPQDEARLQKELESFRPELIINCSALTIIPDCEKNPDRSFELNVGLALCVARIAATLQIPFVHYSTDQVFDGKKGAPYDEEDKVNPLHIYGQHKLQAERELLDKYRDYALVIRTNIAGFRDDPRKAAPFVEWLVGALRKGESITLYDDFITSSVHVHLCATQTLDLVRIGYRGLIHLACPEPLSKWEFGARLAESVGLSMKHVRRASMKDIPLDPPRPLNVALGVHKAERVLGRKLPRANETLRLLREDYRKRFS